MTKQMSKNEALERIEFGIRQSCPEANGSNIGECNECWRFPCNDMKALLVLRDLTEEERPQGEWVKKGGLFYTYECSACGGTTLKEWRTDFCPNCGAKMEVQDDT